MAERDRVGAGASELASTGLGRTRQPRASDAPAQAVLEGLEVDRDGEIPIGVQLAWALRARIGDGRLAPGHRLPGLRELADVLGINANTARAVYQRLEQEGLIESVQGTGTFVAPVSKEPSAAGRIAAEAARQARRTGVDPREVAAALYVAGREPLAEEAARAAERRRELRAQIAALEQALSEIQASRPGLIPSPAKPARNAGPRLLSVAELERVRAELVRRLAAVESVPEEPASGTADGVPDEQSTRAPAPAAAQQRPRQRQRQGAKEAKPAPRPRPRPSTA
jgi:DNA-binding transcriptional regulator YhcF (GntR family)